MNPDSTVEGLYPDMLKPAIKLRVLVDLIIRTNGFYWESDFFASDLFGDFYMTLAPGDGAGTAAEFRFGQCCTRASEAISAQDVVDDCIR